MYFIKKFNLIANISKQIKIVNLKTNFFDFIIFYIQKLNKFIN